MLCCMGRILSCTYPLPCVWGYVFTYFRQDWGALLWWMSYSKDTLTKGMQFNMFEDDDEILFASS